MELFTYDLLRCGLESSNSNTFYFYRIFTSVSSDCKFLCFREAFYTLVQKKIWGTLQLHFATNLLIQFIKSMFFSLNIGNHFSDTWHKWRMDKIIDWFVDLFSRPPKMSLHWSHCQTSHTKPLFKIEIKDNVHQLTDRKLAILSAKAKRTCTRVLWYEHQIVGIAIVAVVTRSTICTRVWNTRVDDNIFPSCKMNHQFSDKRKEVKLSLLLGCYQQNEST